MAGNREDLSGACPDKYIEKSWFAVLPCMTAQFPILGRVNGSQWFPTELCDQRTPRDSPWFRVKICKIGVCLIRPVHWPYSAYAFFTLSMKNEAGKSDVLIHNAATAARLKSSQTRTERKDNRHQQKAATANITRHEYSITCPTQRPYDEWEPLLTKFSKGMHDMATLHTTELLKETSLHGSVKREV